MDTNLARELVEFMASTPTKLTPDGRAELLAIIDRLDKVESVAAIKTDEAVGLTATLLEVSLSRIACGADPFGGMKEGTTGWRMAVMASDIANGKYNRTPKGLTP